MARLDTFQPNTTKASCTIRSRADVLRKAADIVERDSVAMSKMIMEEAVKTVVDAVNEVRELVDSGQLTDEDKREIKKMFAESLGGGDVDEKIREANKNRDQLDAQAREALDLLNKLMV